MEHARLPAGWRRLRLDDIKAQDRASVVSGPFGSNISAKFFVPRGVPVIRGNNLTLGTRKFVDVGFVYITDEKAHELRNCEAVPGDLVFTAAGTLGQVGLIPENASYPRYIISNKQLRLRCNTEIACPQYVYYWFSSPQLREYIANQNTGASVPLITLGILREFPIHLPLLPAQRKIASILSAYDDLIENTTRHIAVLEEMAQLIYREWFVHFRFPGHEHARMVDSPLGPIPEGCEVGRLDDALVLQRGFDLPTTRRREGCVPVYAATGVVGTHSEAKVKAPGVVTGRSGSLGTVMYVEHDFWPLNTTLWVKEFRRVTPLYAFNLLTGLKLGSFNSGAAVPTLNRNDIHGLPVVVPPRAILEAFDRQVLPLLAATRNLAEQNNNLRLTRDLLLSRLISGELDVTDLDIDTGGLEI